MAIRTDRHGMPKIETSAWRTGRSLAGELKNNALLRLNKLEWDWKSEGGDPIQPDRGPFQDLALVVTGLVLRVTGFRPDDMESPVTVSETLIATPGRRLHRFLDVAGFFIPKSIREPFWRDLVDDRDDMVKAGRSAWFIRCAIASQIVWLVVLNLKDVVVSLATGQRATPK